MFSFHGHSEAHHHTCTTHQPITSPIRNVSDCRTIASIFRTGPSTIDLVASSQMDVVPNKCFFFFVLLKLRGLVVKQVTITPGDRATLNS